MKSKTEGKPEDLLCLTACTRLMNAENGASLHPSSHLAGRAQRGQGTDSSKRCLDQKRAGEAMNVTPLLQDSPPLSNKEVLGCLNSRILSVHPKKDNTAQTMALHLPCATIPSPVQLLPACSGSVCFSHSGGSHDSTHYSHPRG